MELNFRSDNESPAAPAIMAALIDANHGTAWAYAEDSFSERLDDAFSELFGTTTTVVPLSTGTVANAIALACVTPPWGGVFCHRNAHILNDECGAPEFFGNGLRLIPVDGPEGKFTASALQQTIVATAATVCMPMSLLRSASPRAPSPVRFTSPKKSVPSALWPLKMTWPLTWTAPASAMRSPPWLVTPVT